jgi:hypothetical protein
MRRLGNSLSFIARRFAAVVSTQTQLEKPKQDLVSLCRQIVDRARPDFGVDAIDELLLDFGRQIAVTREPSTTLSSDR